MRISKEEKLSRNRVRVRNHYYKNRSYYIEKAQKQKDEITALMNSLKTPCIECGESDIRCLDFHHIDPATKKYSISLLRQRGSARKLIEECKKCVVLCSNCHRKLHRHESGNREDYSRLIETNQLQLI